MRTPEEDDEVTRLLRDFDRVVAALQALGISGDHLRSRITEPMTTDDLMPEEGPDFVDMTPPDREDRDPERPLVEAWHREHGNGFYDPEGPPAGWRPPSRRHRRRAR